ncbi:MAG TPA: polysaccharide biosynthesis tyrosine autokinase [Terracidiphilus sp.]|nr:polysaccharide biosynthesis tyrosine autokinase [Terracidiphilus sp.]
MAIRANEGSDAAATRSDLPVELAIPVHEEEPFRVLLQFLKKRAWILACAVLVGALIGILVNRFSVRLYTARASIALQSGDASSQFRVEQSQSIGADVDTAERIDTEIEIIHSRALAFETIRSLHLDGNPEFYPFPVGHPWDLSRPEIRAKLIANFLGTVKVTRLGHTDIIEIYSTSESPELARMIANSLIDRYIEHSFHENYAATAKISSWLDDQLGGLKAKLEKSQQHILDLQKSIGIYGIDQSHSVVAANLEELNKQYADAQVDRLLKESRLEQIKSSSPDVIDAALGSSDPALVADKQRLAQLNDQYSALAETYGLAYPRLKTLRVQVEQAQKELEREERAQRARSQKEFEAARANEAKLLSALKQQEEEVFGKGEKAVEYELARSEYETNRLLYDGLQQRLEEASIMAGLHSTLIHTLDTADVPSFPSSPRTRFNLAIGVGLGFAFGLGLALLLEAMDTNLKTMSDIESSLQAPLIAAIPEVDADHLVPAQFKQHAMAPGGSSWSRIAEALRGMRTSILLSSPGAPPKVIMLVSTRPQEGKTSISALTAITFGLNGSRVLLIDGDLRRPAIHLRFRIGKGLGLSSVLSGKAALKDAIVEWPDLPSLHILPSGPVPPLPSELLGSKQMEDLLRQARDEYDFVVLDTAPVLAVTDASVLGRLVDGVILVLRYGAVQRQVARRVIDMLDRSGAHLLGVAVNVVNYSSPDYSEYYGRKYYDYYGERNAE